MAVFAYRALTAAGRAEAGVVDADSRHAAWEALRARGVWPTALDPQAVAEHGRRVPPEELAAVARQLSVLAAGGVPVAEALEAAAEATTHATLLAALTRTRAAVREGRPVADALAASPAVFPPLWVELVRAGEAAGALPDVLARVAAHAERSGAVRARLRAALAYPAVLAVATAAVLGFLLAWVLPQMAALFAEARTPLPPATRVLLWLAAAVRASWWVWLGAAAATAAAVAHAARTPGGRAGLDEASGRLPLVGPLLVRAALARALRTLGTVLASGGRLEHAFALAAAAAGNARVATALQAAGAAVREGTALAAALAASPLVPAAATRLVAAGERGGALPATLEHAADALDADVERRLAALTTLAEPALVVLMGVAVAVVVVAVLVPILSLDPIGAAG